MRTGEPTINTALAEVLGNHGHDWIVDGEGIGSLEHGRADVLVIENGWPVVIETEVNNHRSAERDARARLGNKLAAGLGGKPIHAALALVYPDALRNHQGKALRRALESTLFEYALYTMNEDGTHGRFPDSGWITGGIRELALLVHRSTIPAWQVDTMADKLADGVLQATGLFDATATADLGSRLGEVLRQEDDAKGQTRRMAMTVLTDALIFHTALAEAGLVVPAEPPRQVLTPSALRQHGVFPPTRMDDEWSAILAVNYWPIFHTSRSILRLLPTSLAANILNTLWGTAETLVAAGVTRSHDLTGTVFQQLIADRKFLATFYTRPSAATLLAGLALPLHHRKWADANALTNMRIGDFACGTGTLLSAAYSRLGLLHQIHGGNPATLHPSMMERGLVGLDVLNVAVHLTAAMLAGMYPQTPFEGECLLTMPYGRHDWGVSLGSLELLNEQPAFDMFQAAAETAGGKSPEQVHDLPHRIGHSTFDLVIMNPPFTRQGSPKASNIPNPAFAAFGADADNQRTLAARIQRLAIGGHANSKAGLASHFVELAHRKLALGGKLALVLPLSALSGQSWEKVRTLWRIEYSNLVVVTIAGASTHARSFSADTGMAECLVIAERTPPTGPPHATFVVIDHQPPDPLVGSQLAAAITRAIHMCVDTLEDGPHGGTRIRIGDTLYGNAINGNLPSSGPWQLAGIANPSLAQTTHQLTTGHLWIAGADAHHIPVVPIRDAIRRVGFNDPSIIGKIETEGIPQGPFDKVNGCPPGSAYPTLWSHATARERRLVVEPDSHCRPRTVDGEVPDLIAERAAKVWATAGRIHYNRDFRLNSQSLAVAFTEQPTIGGRAWPTVLFHEPAYEYPFALWCNSTLGLMCHWWMANKTQNGRGTTTVTGIPDFPTLDVRALTARQLADAEAAFRALGAHRFLPFNQLAEDPARAALDRVLLEEVLGLPATLREPMQRLRLKLASEPQIHGGKKSKVVFTDDGERSVKLSVQSGQHVLPDG